MQDVGVGSSASVNSVDQYTWDQLNAGIPQQFDDRTSLVDIDLGILLSNWTG